MKRLTSVQYDNAKSRAKRRMLRDLFDRKSDQSFWERLRENPMSFAMNALLIFLFIPSLAVSTVHIADYISTILASYHGFGASGGFEITQGIVVKVHQLAYVSMAEAALIFFALMHGISKRERNGRKVWVLPTHWISVPLFLSLLAAGFIFYANLQADLPTVVALMPPFFTIGIGSRLESMIAYELQRKEEMDLLNRAPERHPNWDIVFNQELWEKLITIDENKKYRDVSVDIKRKAVSIERLRESWSDFSVEEAVDLEKEVVESKVSTPPFPEVKKTV